LAEMLQSSAKHNKKQNKKSVWLFTNRV